MDSDAEISGWKRYPIENILSNIRFHKMEFKSDIDLFNYVNTIHDDNKLFELITLYKLTL